MHTWRTRPSGSRSRLIDEKDNEAKMPTVVGGLGAALLKSQELIAQVDEGRGLASAAKLELEQAAVKRQRLIDITDFESDMVETDGARFFCMCHSSLRLRPQPSYGGMSGAGQYVPQKREGSALLSGTQAGRFGADGSQCSMERRHHLCALADCRSDAFDRT
jgi:hypothetical protein